MNLYDIEGAIAAFKTKKMHIDLLQPLKSGKEAQVYLARYDNKLCALKVYKNHEIRSFNNVEKYVENWWIPSRTLKTAVKKKTRLGLQYVQDTWVGREFQLLRKAHTHGCNVPKPYGYVKNAILMEFIGDIHGPAPMLKDVRLTPSQAKQCTDSIFRDMCTLLELGYIHADLSAFNILWWKEKPVIIDFPQAIELNSCNSAHELIFKDFRNFAEFLEKFGDTNKIDYQIRLEEICRFM